MAVSQRPSPPKPWELQRGRAGLTESRGATNLLSSPSDQTRLRDSGALTSASAAVQKPSESQMSSASQSYIRERSLAGSSAQNGTSTQSTSLDIPPRTPPRPWESTYSPYGGYGSSYGRPYGYGSYSSYRPYSSYSPYSSPYSYGGYGGYGSYGGYGGYGYGGYGRDPKFFPDEFGPPGFGGMVASGFNWVNDFQNIVQTFARISCLLDTNMETMYYTFSSVVRFLDRLRYLTMAEILPAIHAMVFFATLGVAGAKFSEWIRGPPSADGNSDVEAFQRLTGARRKSRILWILLICGIVATFLGPFLVRFIARLLRKRLPTAVAAIEGRKDPQVIVARAIYNYEPEHPDDLPLRAGEELVVIARRGEGWLEARSSVSGRVGIVPENYLQISPQSAAPAIPPRFQEVSDSSPAPPTSSAPASAPSPREDTPPPPPPPPAV